MQLFRSDFLHLQRKKLARSVSVCTSCFPSRRQEACVYLTLISPARLTLELILPLSLACQGKPFQDFLTHILETSFIFFFLSSLVQDRDFFVVFSAYLDMPGAHARYYK